MMLIRILTFFTNWHSIIRTIRSRRRNACKNRVPEEKEFERCFVDGLGVSCSDTSFRTGHDTQAEPREDGQRYSRNPKTYKYPVLPRYPPAGVVHLSRRSAMNNLQRCIGSQYAPDPYQQNFKHRCADESYDFHFSNTRSE